MTVKELRKVLMKYPEDADVFLVSADTHGNLATQIVKDIYYERPWAGTDGKPRGNEVYLYSKIHGSM